MRTDDENEDLVLIREARVEAHIGCTAEERAVAQHLVLDLEIAIPRWQGGAELERTVCYATAVELSRSHTASKQWILVEELADSLIRELFERFAPARRVTATIRKFIVPETGWCGVRISRAREEL